MTFSPTPRKKVEKPKVPRRNLKLTDKAMEEMQFDPSKYIMDLERQGKDTISAPKPRPKKNHK